MRGLDLGLWPLAILLAFLLAPGAAGASPACPPDGERFPAQFPDPVPFQAAIAQADAAVAPSQERLTGITVPHHMLVGALIAEGFRAASGFRPKRIVILAPDHFRRAKKPFAIAAQGFDTAFGPVAADTEAVAALLKGDDAEASCLFTQEHGVGAMLPFVRHYFPGVPVAAVAIAVGADRGDWDRFGEKLKPLLGYDTLLVQSTDFSHFLPAFEARRFDQQVLNLLAAGDLDGIAALHQPAHVDSVGAFYLQARLQAGMDAFPIVVANENGQSLARRFMASTTSYMVVLWGRFPPGADPAAPGVQKLFLAGDTFFGRAMTAVLADEKAADRVAEAVRALTHGRPLVVNLEGVILPEVPAGLAPLTLAMPAELALPFLKRLGVAGVGLANNHALDLGPSGLAETRAALAKAGIPAAAQGETLVLSGLDLVMLSDHGTNASGRTGLITPALLDALLREGGERPVVAFVHWGQEWLAAPGAGEKALAREMVRRATTVIAGAHPHRASQGLTALAGGDAVMAYSLGNFLFDQTAPRGASGALLELYVFPQGTVFARPLALPNLFEFGLAAAQPQPAGTSGR